MPENPAFASKVTLRSKKKTRSKIWSWIALRASRLRCRKSQRIVNWYLKKSFKMYCSEIRTRKARLSAVTPTVMYVATLCHLRVTSNCCSLILQISTATTVCLEYAQRTVSQRRRSQFRCAFTSCSTALPKPCAHLLWSIWKSSRGSYWSKTLTRKFDYIQKCSNSTNGDLTSTLFSIHSCVKAGKTS